MLGASAVVKVMKSVDLVNTVKEVLISDPYFTYAGFRVWPERIYLDRSREESRPA